MHQFLCQSFTPIDMWILKFTYYLKEQNYLFICVIRKLPRQLKLKKKKNKWRAKASASSNTLLLDIKFNDT